MGDRFINKTQREEMRTQGSVEKEEKGISNEPWGETDSCCGRRKWMERRMEQSRDPVLFCWICQGLLVLRLPPDID